MNESHVVQKTLKRELTEADAFFIGVSSMVGAGVFVSFGPATHAAGAYLPLSLCIAGFIALCNARSTTRLAALYPLSGGTYVYGTKRLGPLWGYLAGIAFIFGKLASCAAISLTIGQYLAPQHAKLIASLAVTILTSINYVGVQKSAAMARVLAIAVVIFLLVSDYSLVAYFPNPAGLPEESPPPTFLGVLQGAGFLFFAFAGYARVATLGEEVKNPERTIPRAVTLSLIVTFGLYLEIAVTLIVTLGIPMLSNSDSPLLDAITLLHNPALTTIVKAGAVMAALGSLLSLLLGVSRTTFAMARDGNLPSTLSAVHSRFQVPHRAEVVVGLAVLVGVWFTNLSTSIGYSSFLVLLYYAIANASAFTLGTSLKSRLMPILGFIGCCAVALSLPFHAVGFGCTIIMGACFIWFIRRGATARV